MLHTYIHTYIHACMHAYMIYIDIHTASRLNVLFEVLHQIAKCCCWIRCQQVLIVYVGDRLVIPHSLVSCLYGIPDINTLT